MTATRREAIAAGAASAAVLALDPASAFAKSVDRRPLSGLVAYQQAATSEYAAALARGSFAGRERDTLERFHGQSAEAAAALRKALEGEGAKPPAAADPATIPTPPDWLRDVIRVEELALTAYYTALQTLDDERHLRGAVAFMAQAGRRLVILRELAGRPLLPRAFETGGA
jgi:hypothetical protein